MPSLLIVDDDPLQRNISEMAAETAGGFERIALPKTWEEAVELQSSSSPFTVAVIDLGFGRWGKRSDQGIDYLRDLHVFQPKCLILAVSSQNSDTELKKAVQAGANDFVNLQEKQAGEKLAKTLSEFRDLAQKLSSVVDGR